jgi:hypothetical protein
MEDITRALDATRACLRDLWDTYFYAGDTITTYPAETRDLFEEIEVRVFGALVLQGLSRLASMDRYRVEPLPFLLVEPSLHPGTPLLINRPSSDGNRYWDAFHGEVESGEVTLYFMQWFDWDVYARREYQYYEVQIGAFPARSEFVGRRALIEQRAARVLFDASVPELR